MPSQYTDIQIDDNIEKFYNSLNTVNVSARSGSTVTLSKDSEVLYAIEKDGVWTFHPMSFGSWTAAASMGQVSSSTTININSIAVRNITLSF